ncbi:tetratricopeptide repeat protein [Aquimarina pacifica]|uniref:tetratricopeptide repeat protein n=1 Tax=Aquimarina pacifica TaxID=1296415 RepID=UPI000472234C|nr:tetratricopeptide repeat protein [Aquimarina pacifica]
MERTQDLFEHIDQYLSGSLKGKDLESFTNSLKSDKSLQIEVERHSIIRTALQNEGTINFRKNIERIDQEIENEKMVQKTHKQKSFWSPSKIAAIFIVLIGLSSIFWFYNSDKKDLFAAYYVAYPMTELTRGESTVENLQKEIAQDYKNGAYQKVIPSLVRLTTNQPTNDQLKIYLGNSYLNTNQEDKAAVLFATFTKENTFYKDAQWFLALSYLKQKKNDKAILILENLVSFESLYKNKAQNLLKDLR